MENKVKPLTPVTANWVAIQKLREMTKYVIFYKVGVRVNDGNGAVSVSVTLRKSLCDGRFHEVTGGTFVLEEKNKTI